MSAARYLDAIGERRPLARIVSWVGRAATLASELGDLEAYAPTPDSKAFAVDVLRALAELELLDVVASDFVLNGRAAAA